MYMQRFSTRAHGFTKMSAEEKYEAVVEENQELSDRVEELEERLQQAARELEAMRAEVEEQRLEAERAREEAEARARRREEGPRLRASSPPAQEAERHAAPPVSAQPTEAGDAEEQLRERLGQAQAENSALQAELARLERLGRARLAEVEDAQVQLEEARRALDWERQLSRQAQQQGELLREQLEALRGEREPSVMVMGRETSLAGADARRRRERCVSQNLLSQLAGVAEESDEEEEERPAEAAACQELEQQLQAAREAEAELLAAVRKLEGKLAVAEKLAQEWREKARASVWDKLGEHFCATARRPTNAAGSPQLQPPWPEAPSG